MSDIGSSEVTDAAAITGSGGGTTTTEIFEQRTTNTNPTHSRAGSVLDDLESQASGAGQVKRAYLALWTASSDDGADIKVPIPYFMKLYTDCAAILACMAVAGFWYAAGNTGAGKDLLKISRGALSASYCFLALLALCPLYLSFVYLRAKSDNWLVEDPPLWLKFFVTGPGTLGLLYVGNMQFTEKSDWATYVILCGYLYAVLIVRIIKPGYDFSIQEGFMGMVATKVYSLQDVPAEELSTTRKIICYVGVAVVVHFLHAVKLSFEMKEADLRNYKTEQQLKLLKGSHTVLIDRFNRAVGGWNKHVDEANDLETQVNALRTENGNLQTRISNLSDKNRILLDQNETLITENITLSVEKSTLIDNNGDLKAANNALSIEKDILVNQKGNLEIEIANLNIQIKELNEKVKAKEKAYTAEINEQNPVIQALQKDVDFLMKQKVENETKLYAGLDVVNDRVQGLRKEMTELQKIVRKPPPSSNETIEKGSSSATTSGGVHPNTSAKKKGPTKWIQNLGRSKKEKDP